MNNKEDKKTEGETAKKKLSTAKKTVLIVACVLIALLAVAYIFRHEIINLITKPEDDPRIVDNPYGETDTADDTEEPETEYVPEGDLIYNILVCGHDRVGVNTDVNLLINFNVTNYTASIMQIPRDVNATFSPYSDGMIRPTINSIFGYCRTGDYESDPYIQNVLDQYEVGTDIRGIAGFAAYLERNLCVKIHRFAVMDLTEFSNIVDALGGVEMDVPYDLQYDDPDQNLHINIRAGKQTLDGAAAEGIVRYRERFALADLGRANMQKMFMASLMQTLRDKMNIFNIGKITDVCGIIADNLTTNMSTSDMIYFANNAIKMDLSCFTFMTVPVGGYYDEERATWYTCLNKEATLEFINTYFNIFDTPVTPEQFDAAGVFYMDSAWYYGPGSMVTKYINVGSEMVEDGFKPDVGYYY